MKNRDHETKEKLRVEAQTKSFEVLQRRLNFMCDLLHQYGEQIKNMQVVTHGSLYPAFSVCKGGKCCMGCLHIEWKRYFDPAKDQKKRNAIHGRAVGEKDVKSGFHSERIKNVKSRLPVGEEYRELRETIKAFESVREQRKKLVDYLKKALQSTYRFDC